MTRYRRIPLIVDAVQWQPDMEHELVFNHPLHNVNAKPCKHCGYPYSQHGWVETLEGGQSLCPGDWLVEYPDWGDVSPCKGSVFPKLFEAVDEVREAQQRERHETIMRLLGMLEEGQDKQL